MRYAIVVFGLLALVVFGVVVASEALDSAANGWAVGMKHVAYRDVAVAEIEADTKITLKQLDMIDGANSRAIAAAFAWPVGIAGILLVWWLIKSLRLSTPPSYGAQAQTMSEKEQAEFERRACQMERDYYERMSR